MSSSITLTPNDGSNHDNTTFVSDAELVPYIQRAAARTKPDKTRKKLAGMLRSIAIHKFGAPSSQAEHEAIELRVKRALEQAEGHRRNRDKLTPFIIDRERVEQINWIDKAVGYVAIGTMGLAIILIPTFSAIMQLEASKFPLVADHWEIAALMGSSALAGTLSTMHYRHTLHTDVDRRVFDQRLLKGAATMFAIWAAVSAVAAFPISFGGEAISSADGWSESSAEFTDSGFTLSVAPSVSLFTSALLELIAAPALHLVAKANLTPSRASKTRNNPAITHYNEVTLPAADVEVQVALTVQKRIADRDLSLQSKIDCYVNDGLARFDAILSQIKDEKASAVDRVLQDRLSANGLDIA